jgi:P4 family phage/plasmid primase-like protien
LKTTNTEEGKQSISFEEAIKWYRREGINFIPLQYKDKRPVSAWKEYQTRKITDEEVDIFFNNSEHNLGVVCGAISDNLFVLDFDTEEIFNKYFLAKKNLVYVKTSRGYHVYFKADKSIKPLKCFDAEGREILTLKSEGGYVVAPPSTHPSGAIYAFQNQGEIPRLKGDVREEAKKRALACGLNFGNAEVDSEIVDIALLLAGVPRGGQDNAIMHIAHYLRRQEASFEDALTIMQTWNKLCDPVIPESEIYEKLNNHYQLPEPYSFFYKTNPAKTCIMLDLSLEQVLIKSRKDAFESNLYDVDDKGKETINIDRLLEFLEEKQAFVSIGNSHNLFIYKNGVYVPNTGALDVILERLFGSEADIRFKLEINKHIGDRNAVERSVVDSDKTRLPVKNGLLNLDTNTLEPFTPEKIYTSGLDVTYDQKATASAFITTVKEILPGDDVLTMQELFGFCLWRDYPSAKSFWLIGDGGNGKTMLMNVLTNFLSYQNVSQVMLSEMDGQHRFALYELFGKLANIIPEPTTTKRMEGALFKAATGNDTLVAEIKGRQTRFSFNSFAKQIIYANSLPQIADDKKGMWDRLLLISFPVCFRGMTTENTDLANQLSTPESLSGILNWSLQGLSRLRKNNWHFTSTSMQQMKKTAMRISSNPVAAFKESWLSLSRNAEIPGQFLYDAYELFLSIHGVPDSRGLFSELEKDGRITVSRVRTEGRRMKILKGCELSKEVIACYGIYRDRPLRSGEIEDIEDPAKEVEVRTCGVGDYLLQYCEPSEEVEQLIGNKSIIFNCSDLISLYIAQAKRGAILHQSPQTHNKEPTKAPNSTKPSALFIHAVSPFEEGLCERCGKHNFLGHEMTDEEGAKSLICGVCAEELNVELNIKQAPVFGTTLEQRRIALKKSDEMKEGHKQ